MKTCRDCGETKPFEKLASSWNNQRGKRYYLSQCKDCYNAGRRGDQKSKDRDAERKRERYATDEAYRLRIQDQYRLSHYGITREQYDDMWERQGRACAICRTPNPNAKRKWHLDHDHSCCSATARSCGKCVRGILCQKCSVALGGFDDDPIKVHAAWIYLTTYANERMPA